MQEKYLNITLFKETHPSIIESIEKLKGSKNPYSLTKKEIADEIRRKKISHMNRYRPIVFSEGRRPSYFLKFCSPEAAYRQTESDLIAKEAEKLGIDVVYLDEGFEDVNPYAKTASRLFDQVSLYTEMVKQIQEKRVYLHEKFREYRKKMRELPENSKERKKLYEKIGHIADKITATFVYSDSSIDSCYFPVDMLSKDYRTSIPGENAVLNEAIKKYDSVSKMTISVEYSRGREDFWVKKFEDKVKNLPLGSRAVIFVGVAHVDGLPVNGYDYNWLELQKNRELNRVIGKFKEKLKKRFGKVNEIDVTEKKIREDLLKKEISQYSN